MVSSSVPVWGPQGHAYYVKLAAMQSILGSAARRQ